MHRICRALLAGIAILGATHAAADARFEFARTPGALPKDVVPIEYALHVVPDLAGRTFRASGTYRLEVLRPTRALVLHGLDIDVVSATLVGPGRRRIALAAPVVDRARQLLRFALPRPVGAGRHTLELAWTGRLNATPEGFYAEPYRAPAGERALLITFMEPTNARRMLPCWDEPSFRARFRLSVELPPGFVGYSNTPVVSRRGLPGGGERLQFATTPKMASYLFAFAAGELERVSETIAGIEVGVVATAGKLDRAAFALAASRQLLPYYNDYFGVRYPLPKLDHIAQPGGFGGAMENWGAIIYTETTLLVDPARTPERERRGAYGVIAHEVAHQWFGDLVTMGWWDDLWLNEAFAEWMALKATDRFNPQWRIWLGSIDGRERAMDLDARATTHPIRQPIADESQAERAFDAITYEKGSGLMRMLEAWLGEATFRAGMRGYMAKHRYGNTTGADLWAALGAASGRPVGAVAADWIEQPGFPLLSVDARCENGRRQVTLEQQPFSLGEQAPVGGRTWRIPVQLSSTGDGAGRFTLLQERAATVGLPGCAGALVVDADNVGFFRVRYAPALFDALLAHWAELPDASRMKLLADSSALVRSGQLPLANWLALVRQFGDEPRLALWVRLLDELRAFDRLLVGDPARPALHRFAVRLLQPRFARLGWSERPGEPADDRQLRGLLAEALSRYDDAATIADGQARFQAYVADRARVPTSLVEAVLRIAGRHADAATWAQLESLARNALGTEEQLRYYEAMADARDPALVERNLALATSPEVPRLARTSMLKDVAQSGSLRAAWDYARGHADALLADTTRYVGGRYFGRIVDTAASAEIADELEAFAAAKLPADALADVRRAADEIRTRALHKARLRAQLAAALAPS